MAGFNGLILTKQGIDLQLKVQAGQSKIAFTRIAIGDGELQQGYNIEDLTGLINERLSLQIQQIEVVSPEHVKIKTSLNNFEFTEGMYVRELGLFAKEEDGTEILYSIGNSGEKADYIPASGDDVVEETLSIITTVGNSLSVINKIDESLLFVTKKELEKRIEIHNTDEEAHQDIREQISILSNTNLLINGDFRVDYYNKQPPFKKYSYIINRWSIAGPDEEIDIQIQKIDNESGIRILNPATKETYIRQYLEDINVPNGLLTVSCKINGEILHCTYRNDGSIYSKAITSQTKSSKLAIGRDKSVNGFSVQVICSEPIIEIEWVKLEVGEYVTPFIPRLIEEEKELCERYYKIYKYIATSPTLTGDLVYTQSFSEMRTYPTMKIFSISGIEDKVSCYNGEFHDCNLSNQRVEKSYFSLRAVRCVENVTSWEFTVELDAEIY